MAFCGKCGSPASGRFCIKCGAEVAAPAPQAAPAAQAADKTSPIVWILAAVFGLFLLAGIAVVGAGYFVAHKVKQAGFDPELIKNNPGLAVTKMLAATNPDIDVVSVNEGKGLITLKDKKTGKTVTVNFEDVKQGKISFESEGEPKVTLQASGEGSTGALEVKSAEGSLKIGAGGAANLPDWIPPYPGSKPEANLSMQGKEGTGGSFHFTTADPPKNVISFYDDKLKQAGFRINLTATGGEGSMLAADDASSKRTLIVIVGTDQNQTSVNVTFSSKP
ncbi:MAG: hypothetical protein HYR60_03275 [Acidobacteria bacterium]|nr:hypothetical protein [Acidobacteriota bacterium]